MSELLRHAARLELFGSPGTKLVRPGQLEIRGHEAQPESLERLVLAVRKVIGATLVQLDHRGRRATREHRAHKASKVPLDPREQRATREQPGRLERRGRVAHRD